ncbi:FAD-dependent oxidoreductase [Trujillonella humicola]|uniref:FAD-dependent oxidoreductase n=1 Tax=Trujillonella humicola TaxID=3383699 RepID=UPI0039059DBB
MRTASGPRRVAGTAVVVGASMAGLCAARVAAERFDRVVVLDRDGLPAGPDPRGRVPQGRHPHLLLVSGARILDRWFPGIVDELLSAGAVDVDLCGDAHWYQEGGVMSRPRTALRSPSMSRPLLEHVVRRRVTALPRVTLRGGTTVVGLVTDASRTLVTGVRLDTGAALAADLVVDATGRQARSLGWLDELGFAPPAVSEVHVDTRYVSRTYRRGELPARDWKGAGVIDAPATRRMAMALPIEGDRWVVSFGGLEGEAPPVEGAARLDYARSLPSPVIAQIMAASEPLGEPATHRFPANQRRHVEKLRRFPLGWVLLGDAVCSFDPIYGQGMTAAALQAEALGACLDRAGAVDAAFARRYFRRVGRVVSVPWSTAVGGDFAYPDTRGPKPVGTDLLNRYVARAMRAAHRDDAVWLRVNEVMAMVRRPESLVTPGIAVRVLVGGQRRRSGRASTASHTADVAQRSHRSGSHPRSTVSRT